MLGENHSLDQEFPEFKERIHELKVTDDIFAKQAQDYHELDHRIRGLEVRDQPTTDQHINEMKKARARLKDTIYRRLNFK